MGSYDGAEVCKIVGLFMLDMLSKLFEKNYIGLYRDDGQFLETITAIKVINFEKILLNYLKNIN